jgi:hypothetical protein
MVKEARVSFLFGKILTIRDTMGQWKTMKDFVCLWKRQGIDLPEMAILLNWHHKFYHYLDTKMFITFFKILLPTLLVSQ